jgi:predicted RNA-binding Zn-ribbon protein involved in translation (DUF1610 family)
MKDDLMKTNPNLLAPCGLYCGVCGIYYATRDKNNKFMERLLGIYQAKIPGLEKISIADLRCEGCLSDQTSIFCSACAIKDCARKKDISGCHECNAFPCAFIENFPMPVGKKVILRTIPYWRKCGTEKFVADEEARYTCPNCGNKIFRGAKRCNKCKIPLDLD